LNPAARRFGRLGVGMGGQASWGSLGPLAMATRRS